MVFIALSQASLARDVTQAHGISMHGTPALAADFKSLPYANLNAPKGGKITYGVRGSFDSVNPFILRGQKVGGLRDGFYGNNVYESLLMRSRDEPFTMYGLLAETVITPDDRSFIEFKINPKAAFSDGHPVTADDVIFSAELLAEKGRPNYQKYYSKITSLDKIDERTVRIVFNDEADRELPLLLGLLPILPEHAIDRETFDKTTLKPILGSGPYILSKVDQGASVTLSRNPDYWAKDLPIKQGLHNFDTIEFTYYRDRNALFEAFKKGIVDVYFESNPDNWKTSYGGGALAEGRITQTEVKPRSSSGMRGYAFNTRRPHLASIKIREAMTMLFDFEWMNSNLFNKGFERTESFFHGSNLSSIGKPASKHEKELLKDHLSLIRSDILDGTFHQTKSDGSGRDRTILRKALGLFREEGYSLKNRVMVDKLGKPFEIELLLPGGSSQERIALSYAANLRNLGIKLIIRNVDAAQFEERRKNFDFDMISWRWSGSLSPGNEQYFRWSSPFADRKGSYNFSGVKNPGVDAMIDELLRARKREDFVDAVRALDRLLVSGFYVLPHYHLGNQLIALSSHIHMPKNSALYGTQPATWWAEKK
ncbi:MAG: extracellular solute-binding protein [Hyphomicrobiales bacterium]